MNHLPFQVRQACLLAAEVPASFLEKELYNYRIRHPNATYEEALDHVVKWKVPPKLEGSPRDHRENLETLLTVCHSMGLPNLLVTLTADDKSEVRWTEIDDLERVLHLFNEELTFADAPVECSEVFVARFKKLMEEDILNSKNRKRDGGIFGRVLGHMVRCVETPQNNSRCMS